MTALLVKRVVSFQVLASLHNPSEQLLVNQRRSIHMLVQVLLPFYNRLIRNCQITLIITVLQQRLTCTNRLLFK